MKIGDRVQIDPDHYFTPLDVSYLKVILDLRDKHVTGMIVDYDPMLYYDYVVLFNGERFKFNGDELISEDA